MRDGIIFKTCYFISYSSFFLFFLDKIRNKKLSTRQVVKAINTLAVSKIAPTLSVAKLEENFQKSMDLQTTKFIKSKLNIPWNLMNEKIFDRERFGLTSIADVQKKSLTSTVVNQFLNTKNRFIKK